MLCRCSQQERVIALGVWSSLRRIGSSGQSCQALPKDSPGWVRARVCVLCVRALVTSQRDHHYVLHAVTLRYALFVCIWTSAEAIHVHQNMPKYLLPSPFPRPVVWQLHLTNPLAPWQWQSSPRDLSAPSHVPSGPWNRLDAWAITLQ